MSILKCFPAIILFWLSTALACISASVVQSDICIYGATSGGVVAAVTAARLGKSVAFLSLNSHVGGMTASGLGVTDIGPGGASGASYITGVSREFYTRVGQAYGSSSPVWYFEPHVAESVFWQMLEEAGVSVHTNKLLQSVVMDGKRIAGLKTEDGMLFKASQFIDTTYEGDLMAAAGVPFTVGREATSVYGETLAGNRGVGGSYNYDPYVIPANPASGLLPFVQPGLPGSFGQGDHRLQAYNFRLCLTQNATNKLPINPPAGYAEAHYELFRRYLDARIATDGSVSLGQLIHIQTIIPNGKTDINANGELSTDKVGFNYTWATNTYAEREVVRQQHEDYIRGLLYFYATSPNVPANVRTEMQTWGLAKDEFQDTGGWPWQIYVREARRMVSDYVMTQQDGELYRIAPDPIALARYTFDSHGVQRVPSGGYCRWEGSLGSTPPGPYGISYRSIIPGSNQCQNVYCTFALSASHVAFASCRMEPVFMMTSQAAATAAAFAIDDNVPAQQLEYTKLRAQLCADEMVLGRTPSFGMTNGIIVDNQDVVGVNVIGSWSSGSNPGGWNTSYIHDGAGGKGAKRVTFTPDLPTNGVYEVYAWWVSAGQGFRSAVVPIDIVHANGTKRVYVNQQTAGSQWNYLLRTNFNVGTAGSLTIRNDGTTNYVVADAVRFLPVGDTVLPQPLPVVELVASDPQACEFGANSGRITVVRSGDTNSELVVNYQILGSAMNGIDYSALPGSAVLPAGAIAVAIPVFALQDDLPEGSETVTLRLSASGEYRLTTLSNATVTLADRPIDAWRKSHFTSAELWNLSISGDLADPDGDRLSNLVEYALGTAPKSPDANAFEPRLEEDGCFHLTYTLAKSASDVAPSIEQSFDLKTWGTEDLTEVSRTDEGEIERVSARSGTPAASQSGSYIRIRVRKL